jgi:hypothetical protein
VHVIGPGAGLHAAGHDGGVRRLATPPPTAPSAALAYGIGTSRGRARAGHADAARRRKAKNMRVRGRRARWRRGVTAKDIVLAIIGAHRHRRRHRLRHRVSPARPSARCRMEGRMTVCNMAIEAGARAGLVALGRQDHRLPQGPARSRPAARARGSRRSPTGRRCTPTPARSFDARSQLDAASIAAAGHLGHAARRWWLPIDGRVPDPDKDARPRPARAAHRTRAGLHGPEPGTPHGRRRSRQGLHRLVHQQPHRGPARGRRRGRRAAAWRPTSSSRWWCRARAW